MIEDLKIKVENAEKKVEKAKATIIRHQKQLQKKLEKIANIGLDLNNIDLTDFSIYKWNDEYKDYYWEFCEIESKQQDIVNAIKKLQESERVLGNWRDKLNKAASDESLIENEVPQVITDYLNHWKSLAYEWHLKRYEEYREYVEEHGSTYKNIKERRRLFGNIIIEMDSMFDNKERKKWLDMLLEKDKKIKIIDLMKRTKGLIGKITNADCLKVGLDGSLNGIIEGENGKAKLETIEAGGYNIQCYHFRFLVKKIDK